MSTYYRNIQTIKHALKYYITRESASEKDLIREKNLLKKIEEEVNEYKERKNISLHRHHSFLRHLYSIENS